VKVAVAAAGTGGHVYPALAVADALRGLGVGDIEFFGGERIEATAIPQAGYRFHGYRLARLERRLTLSNLAIPWVVHRTASAMAADLRAGEFGVMLGMVGYVSVPAAVAARRAAIPFVLHEQNAAPTLAGRFAARRARHTLLGLPGAAQRLPRATVVGNPLRTEIARFDRSALRPTARARYGLPASGPVVGILGGSLGALSLNRVAAAVAAAAGCPVLHLTGRAAAGVEEPGDASLPWTRIAYEERMHDFYAAVDLVVSRAGAMTVSELAATATPAILVPLERVGQTANAAVLTAAGAAAVVPQTDIATVPGVVAALIGDSARRTAMAQSAAAVARPDAAAAVARVLVEVAGG
jgi:UDP-N-acetylglucosamine--N-acetylmuramyl-(pentapeptide) pyrophosphoryl-undecaprenol N-acetylglucosamine transferase